MNKQLSMRKYALQYLQYTRRHEISQVDFLTQICKKLKRSRESVRGTLVGGGRKLFGQPSFKRAWCVCMPDKTTGKPTRYVRRKYIQPGDVEVGMSYDTPAKKLARTRGLQYLTPGKKKVITLAASEGYCVEEILRRCPEAEITNVERDAAVLKHWKSKNIPTRNFQGTLSKFLRSPEFAANQYDTLNADLMGYACRSLDNDLVILNQLANVKYIVLTILGIKDFRNHGQWVEQARAKYHRSDPTREWIQRTLPRYQLKDAWFYNREPEKGSRRMRMFVLERRV